MDIKWRRLSDENIEELIQSNQKRSILVLTEVTYRLSWAKYINTYKERMEDSNETIIKFAFI